MSSAADLLVKLRGVGLTVEAHGDGLIVRPGGLLTDELRGDIRTHKRELMAELPRYRWRVTGSRCGIYEACFLPEATHPEVSALYPGAKVEPLPDNAPQLAAATVDTLAD